MLMPYVMALVLGRTFDYSRQNVGTDIFSPQEVASKTQTINSYFSKSKVKMVKSLTEALDLLDVSGELSLNFMKGKFTLDASGAYLKSNSNRDNTVEILVKLTYETVTKTLQTNAVPIPLWNSLPKEVLGTHFVRSVTYGGELLASLKFKADNKEDREKIDAALSAGLGLKQVSVSASAKFAKIEDSLKGSTLLTIDYYATTPVEGIPQTLEGFQNLLDNFDKHVEAVNNGLGNPIRVELGSLEVLSSGSNVPNFFRNSAVTTKLDTLISQFDDVRKSKAEVELWVPSLGGLDAVEAPLVVAYYGTLSDVNREYIEAISNMDLGPDGRADQFDKATNAYKGTKNNLPGKYWRELKLLKQTIENLRQPGCFSPEHRNQHLLTYNLIDTGDESVKHDAASSTSSCKDACKAKVGCKSMTFVTSGSSSTCFINFVGLDPKYLIPLPPSGHNGWNVMFYERNQTYCTK